MINFVFNTHLDLVVFTLLGLLSAGVAHRHLRRRTQEVGLSRGLWLSLLLVLGGGAWLAAEAGKYEQTRLVQMVEGVAPTYASELALLGHEYVTLETRPDDPAYLALIEAQKRWLKVNPAVADIYTFGKDAQGKIVLMVDSETDYDRDGRFEGDREQRTAIGEAYEEVDEELIQAFAGRAMFAGTPTEDRWGVWVAAYVPMRNAEGEVYAVLGVDYPAANWMHSILQHRLGALGLAGVVFSVLLGYSSSGALMRSEIARRRRTEAALRASEVRLRSIVDNEPECVMMVNREGTVIEINPAGLRMAQASPEQIVGQPVYRIIRTEHHDRFRQHHEQAFAGRSEIVEVEFQGMQGALHRLWMEIHSVPLRDDEGSISSVLSVARDVTERKHAEAQREVLQQQLVDASRNAGMAEVATNVLHNVGNVLNSVNVAAEMVGSRLAKSKVGNVAKAAELLSEHARDLPQFLSEDQRGRQLPQYLSLLAQHLAEEQRDMQAELARLAAGIGHITEVVRAQQSHAKHSSTLLQSVDPAEAIRDALRVAFPGGSAEPVRVEYHAVDLGVGKMDRHKVIQILVNLLSNARRAVKQSDSRDPLITLNTSVVDSESGRRLRIVVQDNGIGIAPEHQARIFEHGFTTAEDGHGFGLHGAILAAKEMDGNLTFASDGRGKGATFTLEIPWSQELAEAR